MAKKKNEPKKTTKKDNPNKGLSPFDFIKLITTNKKPWTELSDVDKKTFSDSVYIINRTLSMHTDYTDLINYLQRYTIGNLGGKEVYNLYLDILPKASIWAQYISFKGKDGVFNEKLINFISGIQKWAMNETIGNLTIYKEVNKNYINDLKELLLMYGISDSECQKEYGLK